MKKEEKLNLILAMGLAFCLYMIQNYDNHTYLHIYLPFTIILLFLLWITKIIKISPITFYRYSLGYGLFFILELTDVEEDPSFLCLYLILVIHEFYIMVKEEREENKKNDNNKS